MGKAYCPPPMLGSGEVEGRYAQRYELKPFPPLPWYFDATKSMFAAAGAIALIALFGWLVG